MPSSSRKSLRTWYEPPLSLAPDPHLLRPADADAALSPFLQIESSFSLSVPIFKQFHKNIIGKGGANIKKVRVRRQIV